MPHVSVMIQCEIIQETVRAYVRSVNATCICYDPV